MVLSVWRFVMDITTVGVDQEKYGILFKVDGSIVKVLPHKMVRGKGKFDWRLLEQMMNAQSFDFIKTVNIMVVLDQDARLTGKPINPKGSHLCGQEVFGDVLLTHKKLMGM
jgi:hypothetical protein